MTEKGPEIPRSLIASPLAQLVLFILTVIYVVSPIDVVPDVLPIIGWLDDLAVFITQLSAFFFYLKKKRETAEAKQQAGSERDSYGR